MTSALDTRPSPLDQALRYLALGLSVIPVRSRDKRPSIPWKAFQTRRATLEEVSAWFASNPELNVGIVTGAISGIVVIDADSADAVAWMAAHHPSAVRSRTGKGAHFLFSHPGREVRNGARLGGMALDVRGDGGYIVAPGSVHPSGAIYQEEGDWTDLSLLPPFHPAWLGDAVQPLQTQLDVEKRVTLYLDRIPGEAEGGRDNQTYKVACKLVREFALAEDVALAHLSRWNLKNAPPLSLADLKLKIGSAIKSGRAVVGSKLDPKWSPPSPTPGGDLDSGGAGSLQDLLVRTNTGGVKKSPGNLAKILRLDAQWGPALQLNEMSRDVLFHGSSVGDTFIDFIQEQIEDHHGVSFGREDVASKLIAQATQSTIHPVREWLKTLKWDGTERISRIALEILGSDLALSTHYLRSTMIGAVRRVYHPGTKMDTIPVLTGGQGLGKSSFWRTLIGAEFFNDSPIDVDSKDGFQTLARKWGHELAELDHLTSQKAAERIKAFASSSEDVYRPPYGRTTVANPRSCFLVGSTNRKSFLMDPTGSRRFWPIECLKIELEMLDSWRVQLWAEAQDLHFAGTPHWLTPAIEGLRRSQAADFEVEDPWVEIAREAIQSLTREGRSTVDGVSLATLLESMEIPTIQRNHAATIRLGEIMRGIGWKRRLSGPERRAEWFPI